MLPFPQYVGNLFNSLIALRKNEYLLIYNVHCCFTNVTSCPLVRPPFLAHGLFFHHYADDSLRPESIRFGLAAVVHATNGGLRG